MRQADTAVTETKTSDFSAVPNPSSSNPASQMPEKGQVLQSCEFILRAPLHSPQPPPDLILCFEDEQLAFHITLSPSVPVGCRSVSAFQSGIN